MGSCNGWLRGRSLGRLRRSGLFSRAVLLVALVKRDVADAIASLSAI